MKEYKQQVFDELRFNSDDVVQDLYFEKCDFFITVLSSGKNLIPEDRTLVKNVIFKNCAFNGRGSSQSKAYFKDVLFENAKITADLLRVSGTIFNKVTLKGKFDRLVLSSSHNGMLYLDENNEVVDITEAQARVLDDYAKQEYNNIEWALDISAAEFKECDIRESIPAHLIKRNHETQMLLKYDKVLNSDWENNDHVQKSYAHYFCKRVIKAKNDLVIVAPVRNKEEFVIEMEAIKILRGEGIGECD
jgi:hypothetical protein